MEKVIVKLSEPTSQYQQKILLEAGYDWNATHSRTPIKNARYLSIDIEDKTMSWSYNRLLHSSITFEEFDKKYLNHKYVETKAGRVNIVENKTISERIKEAENILEERKELDKINPSHYKQYSRETIDTMQGSSTPEEFKGYLKLNIIKYISRYQSKNGVEDLKKAQWYLNKLTEVVENEK